MLFGPIGHRLSMHYHDACRLHAGHAQGKQASTISTCAWVYILLRIWAIMGSCWCIGCQSGVMNALSTSDSHLNQMNALDALSQSSAPPAQFLLLLNLCSFWTPASVLDMTTCNFLLFARWLVLLISIPS